MVLFTEFYIAKHYAVSEQTSTYITRLLLAIPVHVKLFKGTLPYFLIEHKCFLVWSNHFNICMVHVGCLKFVSDV